jgi:hypothetical protein
MLRASAVFIYLLSKTLLRDCNSYGHETEYFSSACHLFLIDFKRYIPKPRSAVLTNYMDWVKIIMFESTMYAGSPYWIPSNRSPEIITVR